MHPTLSTWPALFESLGTVTAIPLTVVAAALVAVGVALAAIPRAPSLRARLRLLAPAAFLTANAVGLLLGLLELERARLAGETGFLALSHGAELGTDGWLTLLAVVLTLAVPGLILATAQVARTPVTRRALGVLATGALVAGGLVACVAGA